MLSRGKIKTVSMDDINVDYSSILDQAEWSVDLAKSILFIFVQEDRLRRWSEDVVDHRIRDSVRLNKLYRKGFQQF